MTYVGKKPADIIATAVDTTTGTFSGDLTVDTNTLYVDSANNRVGVGTVSPAHALDVNGSLSSNGNENVMRIAAADSTQAGGININSVYGATASSRVTTIFSIDGQGQDAPLAFGNGTTEAMRIDSSGRVGIGTGDTAIGDRMLRIHHSSSQKGIILVENNASMSLSGVANFGGQIDASSLKFVGDSNTERMRIDSSGNVGIGTSSPAGYRLHVADGTPTIRISGTAETAGLSQNLIFGTPTYNRASIQSTNVGTQGADLKFYTAPSGGNAAERMRIDSSGNVGIGTSSPSYGISVQSATDTSASGSFKRTSGSEIRILPQGVQANIGTYTNHPLVFNTNSTERMAIDVNGHVTMPYQPSFLARPSSRQSNLAINTTHTIAFGTEVFDRGADFASSTFTAPIEGLYQLNVQLLIQQMDSATDYYYINLKTSNRNYDQYWDNDDKAGDNSNGAGVSIVVLADMDAGDTAFVQIIVPNSGSAQMDVETASAFSGFLAC